MSYDDEDDLSPSLSAKYESPTKAKREALKQKLQKEGFKQDANKPNADLKALQLSMLKSQVGGKDDQTKKDEAKEKPLPSLTKTREQDLAAKKGSVNTRASADSSVEQGRQDEEAKQEIKRDEVTGEG